MGILMPQVRSRNEWIAIGSLTAIGLGLRIWPVGRLGLSQFDEGIYAIAASWSMQPKVLADLDPTLISYAPPGYSILGGLAYLLLGRSDGAMIAVSQLAGTLTIPVIGWLGLRTFGRGAGFTSATFCAFSGPHIASSRMALTDASFLLTWLVALGMGLRFLECPGWARAIGMGLAVGLAQQFKYNGYLAGAIVIAASLIGIIARPEARGLGKVVRTFGWGMLSVVVAWVVVWPWYAFVEGHGGYSALLRHQRSYLGGFKDWPAHFAAQMAQADALSGGLGLIVPSLMIAFVGIWTLREPTWMTLFKGRSTKFRTVLILGLAVAGWCFLEPSYLLALLILPWLLGLPGGRLDEVFGPSTTATRLVGTWWLTMFVITPFYHPYARLWLPGHAAHWLLMGMLVAAGLPAIMVHFHRKRLSRSLPHGHSDDGVNWGLVPVLGLLVMLHWFATPAGKVTNGPGLFGPSDSLYQASVRVAATLPEEVRGLRVLVRPPVSFYLSGRVALSPMAGSEALARAGDPTVWALVDSAILRSEAGRPVEGSGRMLLDRFAGDWEVVEEFPTWPSLPTLLDLDPGQARPGSTGDRSYPLWLLRPRTSRIHR